MPARQEEDLGQRLYHRHEVERFFNGDLPPFQRVSRGDHISGQQVFQALIRIAAIRRMNDFCLCLESLHPVLLALTGEFTEPTILIDLEPQTFNNSRDGSLKTPPVGFGTQGVYAITINTAITFEPNQSRISVKYRDV